VDWNSYVLDLSSGTLVVLHITVSTDLWASTCRRAPIEKCDFPLLFRLVLLIINELLIKRIHSLLEESFLNFILELIATMIVNMRHVI
jgi:hypothetical protein